MVDEGLLHRVQGRFSAEPLDRDDLPVLVLYRQGEAGIDALAIDQDGAGPAGALIAAFLRAGKSNVVAKKIEQRRANIEIYDVGTPIDGEFHRVQAPVGEKCAKADSVRRSINP
ncbi:hypothetical protein GCM10007874_28990 [Labrys miyagiensis]|uniref:Uncharacterized protein n=1 Tax=Labrys miyagiensis TaxID=346912 RepID=A0ABQ6CJT0_9HYPH|nr:hypothetical protein GCM10007874_28990 [Labrys miyagiensis]